MAAGVNLDELLDTLEFVSFSGLTQQRAYIDRTSGKIYWDSEESEDELPDDVDDPTRFVEVPQKRDLDLGSRLALRFAYEVLPDESDRIESFFQGRGAYARFKDFLGARGRLEEWYAFEAKQTAAALREWCEQEGLRIDDAPSAASSSDVK